MYLTAHKVCSVAKKRHRAEAHAAATILNPNQRLAEAQTRNLNQPHAAQLAEQEENKPCMAGYLVSDERKVTSHRFFEMKERGKKISMLTAYDYTTASLLVSRTSRNRIERKRTAQ